MLPPPASSLRRCPGETLAPVPTIPPVPSRLPTLLLASTLVSSAAAARAADPEPTVVRTVGAPVRVGVAVGWHATAPDLDVLGQRVEGNEPTAGGLFGLRLGWRASPGWGVDLDAAASPAGSEWLLPVVAMVRWRPLEGLASWTPTVGLGAGLYFGLGAEADVDALLGGSLGFEVELAPEVAVRLEGDLYATDGVGAGLAWSPVVTVGVELRAWRDHRAHVVDEGVRQAPVTRGCPGGVDPRRCGDGDEDGIIDAFDACPVESGTVRGCPDDDGDGVPVPRDACPLRPGAAVDWGCPRGRR